MRLLCIALAAAILCLAQLAVAGVDELEVGGRFMWDATAWSGIETASGSLWDSVDFINGTETRRARIFLKGSICEHLDFKVVYDFADGDEVALKDAYLDLVGIPIVGNVRVGQFLEPLCFNELTSSKYRSFIEAASPSVFAPGRNAGLMAHDTMADDRVNYQVGLFLDTGDMAEREGNDGYSVAARVAYLVAGEAASRRVVHIGGAFDYLIPDESTRFRQRPEVHLSDRLVDTGSIMNAESVVRYGGEFAGVFGALHVAGEYLVARVTKSAQAVQADARGEAWLSDDGQFAGYYAEVGYFLTGEHRVYRGGLWDRTKPRSSFLDDGGSGAWEVSARYSSLDLNDADAGICGGKMDNVTLGLNWYLHSNARFMFNYVMSSVRDIGDEEVGRANAFTMRTQFDF